jgi:hypothetical protein
MSAVRGADATQEIAAADILESAPAKRPPSVPRIRKVGPSRVVRAQPAPPPVRMSRPSPPPPAPLEVEVELDENGPASIGPIAIDLPPRPEPPRPSFDSTVNIRFAPAPPRRLQALVIGVMSASLVILALAAVRSYLATFEVEPPMPALASVPPKRAAPLPPPPVQTVAPTTGTIMLAKGVRGIVVDGARIASTSAVVPCGERKVTAQGKTRTVDVPCGGTYIITP